MYISFREEVQQVPTIVREFVISRGADTGKRWRRGGAEAEPGQLPDEGFQARLVVCTRVGVQTTFKRRTTEAFGIPLLRCVD